MKVHFENIFFSSMTVFFKVFSLSGFSLFWSSWATEWVLGPPFSPKSYCSNSQKLQEVKRGDKVTHRGAIKRNMVRELHAHKSNKPCNTKLCQFWHVWIYWEISSKSHLSGVTWCWGGTQQHRACFVCSRTAYTKVEMHNLYLISKFAVCITQHGHKNDGYQDIHCEKF